MLTRGAGWAIYINTEDKVSLIYLKGYFCFFLFFIFEKSMSSSKGSMGAADGGGF